MLALLVVVADLGTAMVPVMTAGIVFFVAGLEKKYMLRAAMLVGVVLGLIAVVSSPYRLQRVISYVDPELHARSKLIDTGGRLRAWIQRSTSVRDAGYQPLPIQDRRGNRGRAGRRAYARQAEADVPAGSRTAISSTPPSARNWGCGAPPRCWLDSW